jgi:hypothetical protein
MANNTPYGFEEEETEDRYLIDELPSFSNPEIEESYREYIKGKFSKLDTEDKNFEQE